MKDLLNAQKDLNIPQVDGFICSRWWCDDLVWKGHHRKDGSTCAQEHFMTLLFAIHDIALLYCISVFSVLPPLRSLHCWSWWRQVWPSVTPSGTKRSAPTPGICTTAKTRAPPTEASSASGDTSSSSTPWCPFHSMSGQSNHTHTFSLSVPAHLVFIVPPSQRWLWREVSCFMALRMQWCFVLAVWKTCFRIFHVAALNF